MSREEEIERIIDSNSSYMRAWINLLCNTDESLELFVTRFLDLKCLGQSLADFQCYIRSKGRRGYVIPEQLLESKLKGDDNNLKELLEELLLIPVDEDTLKILKKMKFDKLYRFLKKYPDAAILRVTKSGISFVYTATNMRKTGEATI